MSELGVAELVSVGIREVWPHEAQDFTPWLLENAGRLGAALEMNLELQEAEHSVGNFSLDLKGTNTDDGSVVIVENQLERTDHNHLGQLLTYAAGTDPASIIWIATDFRDEHRAALTWLNEHTGEDVNFYGVQVSAVRIDNSRPAVMFDVVVRPNNWEKRVRTSTSSGSRTALEDRYVRFWRKFENAVANRCPEWLGAAHVADNKSSWTNYPSGLAGLWFGCSFAGAFGERELHPGIKALRSELYFGLPSEADNFERYGWLAERRAALEQAYGDKLSFEELPGKKGCRISWYCPGDSAKESEWDQYIEEFIDSQKRLREAVAAVGGVEALPNAK